MDGSASRAAVALRVRGASFAEIAELLGLEDADRAREAVERGLAAEHVDEGDRQRLRAEEEARLLRLLSGLWEKATDPEGSEHVPAARAALAVIDRHSRLLGLDAPTEVVVHNPTMDEIDSWVAEVLSARQGMLVVEGDVVGELES